MPRFLPSVAGWSRWLRLFHVMVLALFWVLVWSFNWAIVGLVLASVVAGLVLVPAIVAPTAFQRFMPWYLTDLPLWLVAGGFVAGGVLGFIRSVRIVLGEVHRALFVAEVQDLAERLAAETTNEPSSSQVFSATASQDRKVQAILTTDKGFLERHA